MSLDPHDPLRHVQRMRLSVALPVIVLAVLTIWGITKLVRSGATNIDEPGRTDRNLVAPERPGPRIPGTEDQEAATNRLKPVAKVAAVVSARAESPVAPSVPVAPQTSLQPEPVLVVDAGAGAGSTFSPDSGLAFPGTIRGIVTLVGVPPAERVIAMDATCGRLHPAPVTTRLFAVGPQRQLADVLVYIKAGLEIFTFEVPAEAVLIDQVGCFYEPYVGSVMVNQKIKFRNSDPLLHNVHATPTNNAEFNFAQPVRGQVNEKSFSRPEFFTRIKCDVHPWMFTYVNVMPHPYFAVSGANGAYQLPGNLPPGTYTIAAIHRRTGEVTRTITVEQDKALIVNFELSVPLDP
ncbi:MAG: hypothetical protein H7X97_10430 [Opitutaceae bacterium]|nr:hypothetical protein [Verrucomicrobiales bacterium]